ncbi:galactose-3-O-sulfotransferase 2-like [Lingula anatina]|uniref:Galactose-3-O-sulfotransferase 2-like n=1 Tax=Lingula anatina TaxID=7574 RepID=A0A1S3K980_LINAN|nr:galactose-3-O-sulfotransferase 2-like [Lingula anatina]|eukprot:XP_013419180.1 galactose-3-O-sulfotransferase 2-like [Lingula anatina]
MAKDVGASLRGIEAEVNLKGVEISSPFKTTPDAPDQDNLQKEQEAAKSIISSAETSTNRQTKEVPTSAVLKTSESPPKQASENELVKTVTAGSVRLLSSTVLKAAPFEIRSLLTTKNRTSTGPDQVSRLHRTCKPNKHVMFLKTHKTGSTTVSNTILRFAYANDLHVALPAIDDTNLDSCDGDQNVIQIMQQEHHAPIPGCFLWDQHDNRVKYDVIAHHWRYDRKIARASMPDDAFYVTIIREPFSRFKSHFSYSNFARKLNIQTSSDPMLLFLRSVLNEKSAPRSIDKAYLRSIRYILRNNMMRDLGFKLHAEDDIASGIDYIKTLDSDFNLVLLTEEINAGMVLLRRRLCWDLKDIIYLKMNAQTTYKSPIREKTLDDLAKLHANWGTLDYQLYQHFRAKFEAEKKRQDKDFWAELAYYEKLLLQIRDYCNEELNGTDSTDFLARPNNVFLVRPNNWTSGFNLTAKDCASMRLFSYHFSVLLKERYYNKVARLGTGIFRIYNAITKKLDQALNNDDY